MINQNSASGAFIIITILRICRLVYSAAWLSAIKIDDDFVILFYQSGTSGSINKQSSTSMTGFSNYSRFIIRPRAVRRRCHFGFRSSGLLIYWRRRSAKWRRYASTWKMTNACDNKYDTMPIEESFH